MIAPRRRHPHGSALALALAFSLVIAGCGSNAPAAGGNAGSSAGRPAGTTAGSAAPSPRDVRGRCEQATRNYTTLVYWQRADAEIAKLPEEQRAADRKHRLAALTHELETRIDFFVDQCVSANNDAQIDCMIAAKTGDEALKCAELSKPD